MWLLHNFRAIPRNFPFGGVQIQEGHDVTMISALLPTLSLHYLGLLASLFFSLKKCPALLHWLVHRVACQGKPCFHNTQSWSTVASRSVDVMGADEGYSPHQRACPLHVTYKCHAYNINMVKSGFPKWEQGWNLWLEENNWIKRSMAPPQTEAIYWWIKGQTSIVLSSPSNFACDLPRYG